MIDLSNHVHAICLRQSKILKKKFCFKTGGNLSKQKANPLALGQISAEVQILKQQWSIWSGNTITWLVDYKAREYLAMFT